MKFSLDENPAIALSERLGRNDLNYTFYRSVSDVGLLTDAQRVLLSHLNRRLLKGQHAEAFRQNASIFAFIDHPEAYNHAHCGESCRTGRVRCRDLLFCQNCANIPANQFLEKTVTRFGLGRWFFVTLSFSSPVVFGSTQMDEAEACWRVTRDVLDVAGELWDGCVYREEVALTDFLPLRIRPHAHLLVYVEDGNLDLEALRGAFDEVATRHGIENALSFDSRPVRDLNDYLWTVRYLFKATDAATVYRRTWAQLAETTSDTDLVFERREVNSQLADFIYGAPLLRPALPPEERDNLMRSTDEGQRRVVYRGVLHPRSRGFMLTKGQVRVARARIDRILREGAEGAKRVR